MCGLTVCSKEAESLGAATLEAPGLARLESAGQDGDRGVPG